MWSLGPGELLILGLLVLIFFGAKRLPELGRSLGSGLKEFRKGLSGEEEASPALPPETPRKDSSQP